MKKILLTTTALVMTAGVAAAEVSFSGKSQVSVTATGNGDNVLHSHIDFNVAVSGTYDNGMTMATSFGYDAGQEADYNDDFALDAAETGFGSGSPAITIGYAGYTIVVDGDKFDDIYDDGNKTGNLKVSGAMGGIDFTVATNIDGGTSEGAYTLGYTTGDITATVTGTNNHGTGSVDATKVVVAYAMGDTTLTVTSDDADDNVDTITKIGVSTKINDISFSYTAASNGTAGSDVGDDWDAKVSYSAGALSASYSLDEDDVSKLVVDYDLGGGATAFASMKAGAADNGSDDFTAMGINFKF
jgi:outer membrane protein OmpU